MLCQGSSQIQGMSRSQSAVCLFSVGNFRVGRNYNERIVARYKHKSTGIETLYPEEVAM